MDTSKADCSSMFATWLLCIFHIYVKNTSHATCLWQRWLVYVCPPSSLLSEPLFHLVCYVPSLNLKKKKNSLPHLPYSWRCQWCGGSLRVRFSGSSFRGGKRHLAYFPFPLSLLPGTWIKEKKERAVTSQDWKLSAYRYFFFFLIQHFRWVEFSPLNQ